MVPARSHPLRSGRSPARERILRCLAPPVFPGDDDKTRRAALLNAALVTLLTLLPFLVIGNLLGGRVPLAVSGMVLALFVSCLGLRWWMRRGSVEPASLLLLLLGTVVVSASVARLGTVRAPSTAMYTLVVISAGLLSGLRGMIAAITACSVAVFGLIVAENAGLLSPADHSVGITQGITYAATFAWTGGLMYSAIGSLRRAIVEGREELAARVVAEAKLAQHLVRLEEIVKERTAELTRANERLGLEVEARAKLIEELRVSLAKVKTLSGILPICMHCKNIRDDKGYWQRVEAFVHDHSEADFTHGVCPACLALHYPGVAPAGT